MPDGMTSDFGGIADFARRLEQVAVNAGPYLNSALQKTSGLIKEDARASVRAGNKRWRALPRTIDYEISVFQGFGSTVIQADIGYNRDFPAAQVGNLREYGSVKVPPHNDLQIAAEKNRADFEDGINRALEDAERILDGGNSLTKSVGDVLGGRIR
jgi:hypothetical protein